MSLIAADRPLTSVIMVSFHTGPDLFAAIDSVLAQSAPVELVLVDNGNPPGVVERLRGMAAAEPRLKFLTGHGNVGFGRANNLGVRHSKGAYVLILNPDSALQSDTVAGFLRHAESLPRPFIIGPRIVGEDGHDQRGCRRNLLTPATAFVEAFRLGRFFPRCRLNRHDEPMPTSLAPVPAISGACMFMPRGDFDRINGFDEGFFLHVEDLDICYRFREAGGEIYFAPDLRITHVGGTSDAPSLFIERCKAESFSYYFRRNFMTKTPMPFLWLLDAAIWGRYGLIVAKTKLLPRKKKV